MSTKTLKHGEQVKVVGMKFCPEITVGTVEGYALQYNEDPAEALARNAANAKANPWERYPLAWTNKAASVLEADYAGKAARLAEKQAKFDSATTLAHGELVEIEGRMYTVHVMDRADSVCDPVHFIPVK
jgi:hypothetical protein